jgi:hypothetical protein
VFQKSRAFASLNSKILSATFAPIPGTVISSSMEQLLIKIRGIVNNNKQQKTRAGSIPEDITTVIGLSGFYLF